MQKKKMKFISKISKILPGSKTNLHLANVSDRLDGIEDALKSIVALAHNLDRTIVEIQNQIEKFDNRKQGTTATIKNIAQLVGKLRG